jgi:hypothetical protein
MLELERNLLQNPDREAEAQEVTSSGSGLRVKLCRVLAIKQTTGFPNSNPCIQGF